MSNFDIVSILCADFFRRSKNLEIKEYLDLNNKIIKACEMALRWEEVYCPNKIEIFISDIGEKRGWERSSLKEHLGRTKYHKIKAKIKENIFRMVIIDNSLYSK